MKWTDEQLQAINEKGSNILVAAAAGSGKTAVLVERIINKIINENMDIDKILVVTFTNLAASQMREKILDAIYKKIEENPENEHLQHQINILSKSNICTIDSFCLDIVKNNFFELDISPNFRIAEQAELKILKQETLDEIFENKYENQEKEFIELINTYTTYKGDENLKEIILKIYNFIQSIPFPDKWLNEEVNKLNINNDEDFSLTPWGKILYNSAKEDIEDSILQLRELQSTTGRNQDIPKIHVIFSEDVRKLEKVYKTNNWQELYEELQQFFFDRWVKDKNISNEDVQELKKKRENIKSKIENIKKEIIIYDSKTAVEDTKSIYNIMSYIKNIVIEFERTFQEKKKEKNIVDFSDIEHYALQILLENEKPSNTAKKYQEKFEEIAIDEYQDSNMVQEYILNTISRNNNIFMVGDVKQSIYKFRHARPELFLNKYNTYKIKSQKKEEDNLKIKLFKNFRSRKQVLDYTNLIFQNIMSEEIGEIDYTEEECLNLGADYKENVEMIPEIHIINTVKSEENETEENEEPIDSAELEAKFVANKIKSMINEKFKITDKEKNSRNVKYKDFVILLRNTKNIANIFEKELIALDIPVFCDATAEYLNSYEIQIIMNLLKIIDNPLNDIAQVTILRSMIGNFNDNELMKIRIHSKDKSFYYSIEEYINDEKADKKIKEKLKTYLKNIEMWRKKSKYIPLDELIWTLYIETGFYNYVSLMQNGEYRTANLKMLFERARQYEKTSFKGLFNFINFIDKLQITSGDMNGAKIIGENENVVRIMSIHKSKGLEFPVVFLSGTGKKFNTMELNKDEILLHNELGLGAKYIDFNLNIKFDTLVKKSIEIRTKQELVSEELRILYVALTRAKEKLIITGIEKDYEKSIKDKQELLKCYEHNKKDKINKNILKKYMRYIDFIELVYLNNINTVGEKFKIEIHNTNKINEQTKYETKKEKNNLEKYLKKVGKIEDDRFEKINQKLNWKYKYITSTKIRTKSSVSKIKQETNINSEETEQKIELQIPSFLKSETKITPAQKGTLTHLVLQKLNEKEEYTIEKIKLLVNNLEKSKIITEKEADAININKILMYTQSNIFDMLKSAKKVYKEQPFYINMPAKIIYEEATNEKILVQGIIDLYFLTKDNKIILVDYKTDNIKNEEILKEKYKKQLEIYKNAIEKSIGRKVDNVYIYSTYLEKSIEC
jgi:ATP-dependent helicase/nuclease subunit A